VRKNFISFENKFPWMSWSFLVLVLSTRQTEQNKAISAEASFQLLLAGSCYTNLLFPFPRLPFSYTRISISLSLFSPTDERVRAIGVLFISKSTSGGRKKEKRKPMLNLHSLVDFATNKK